MMEICAKDDRYHFSGWLTHPGIAALATPLCFAKRGFYFIFLFSFPTLFAAKPERGWSSEAQTG
jgi:hypothetical protein